MQGSYTVVLFRNEEEGGYLIWVPALDCYTQADDLAEGVRMAEELIVAYLDGEQELGKPVPPDVVTFNLGLGESREAHILKVSVPSKEVALAA